MTLFGVILKKTGGEKLKEVFGDALGIDGLGEKAAPAAAGAGGAGATTDTADTSTNKKKKKKKNKKEEKNLPSQKILLEDAGKELLKGIFD